MCAKDVGVTLWSLKYDCLWLKDMDLKHQFIFRLEMGLSMRLLVLLLEISRALAQALDLAIPWVTQ